MRADERAGLAPTDPRRYDAQAVEADGAARRIRQGTGDRAARNASAHCKHGIARRGRRKVAPSMQIEVTDEQLGACRDADINVRLRPSPGSGLLLPLPDLIGNRRRQCLLDPNGLFRRLVPEDEGEQVRGVGQAGFRLPKGIVSMQSFAPKIC